MKPRLNSRAALLALPYVHEKDGAAYVRVPYQDTDGKWRSKEKKLGADASPADAITLIAQIKAKLGCNPNAIEGERMTFDELLREYQRAYPTVPQWYLQPLDSFKGRKIRSLTYARLYPILIFEKVTAGCVSSGRKLHQEKSSLCIHHLPNCCT